MKFNVCLGKILFILKGGFLSFFNLRCGIIDVILNRGGCLM